MKGDKDLKFVDKPASYVIDNIVEHCWDQSGEVRLFRAQWYGCTPPEDTWEPIHYLPRSQVSRYHRRRNWTSLGNLDDAMVGVVVQNHQFL